MANELIQARFAALITAMVAQSEVVKGVAHHGVAGSLRESFVRTVIEPLLPYGSAAVTGILVDCLGGQSGQVDVIVYNRSLMPPVYEGEPSLVPVEAALYSIEVKTTLTKAELEKAVAGAERVQGLDAMQSNARPVPVVFALDSDLSGDHKTELDRLVEVSTISPPSVRVLVVVGRGYWYFAEETGQWMFSPPSDGYAEVVDFLGGFVNTLQLRPKERLDVLWGQYVVRHGSIRPITTD